MLLQIFSIGSEGIRGVGVDLGEARVSLEAQRWEVMCVLFRVFAGAHVSNVCHGAVDMRLRTSTSPVLRGSVFKLTVSSG